MEPLASMSDLIDRGIGWGDIFVQSVLVAASDAVRDAAGVAISRTTSTITIGGTTSRSLLLPGGPVVSVETVLVDGDPVTDWRLVDGQLWRSCRWSSRSEPSSVTITYTHGYDPVPADIVQLVCTLTAAGLAAVKDGVGGRRGVTSVAIDDYRESYATGDDEILDPMELPQRTRDALRSRFSGNPAVVGSFR